MSAGPDDKPGGDIPPVGIGASAAELKTEPKPESKADPETESKAEAPPKPKPYEGLPTPRRHYAVATVMIGISLSVLDATIANVALPAIAQDLDTSAAAAVWIVNAYNVAVVALLLPFSALAERIGFRRMFAMGLALFTMASLGCAMANSLQTLTIARVAQGVGASALMCLMGGLVRNIYPLSKLGMGMSINATTVAVMSVLGPTLGSAILSVAHWPWIFAINVPFGLLALFGVRFLPDVPRVNVRFDWQTALLSMIVFGVFITGVDNLGGNLLQGLGLILVAMVAGVMLMHRCRHQTAPLVPIDLLRIKAVAFAVGASSLTFAAQMCAYVSLPFYFQNTLHRPYIEIGLLMGAWPAGTALIAILAGRLSDKYSAALLSGMGALAMTIGLLTLAFMPDTASNILIMCAMLLAGLGFGFFQTPNNRAMISPAPRNRSGAAGGLQATTRVFGQSMGAAFVAIAFSLSGALHGPWAALLVASFCAFLAVVVNTVRFREMNPKAAA